MSTWLNDDKPFAANLLRWSLFGGWAGFDAFLEMLGPIAGISALTGFDLPRVLLACGDRLAGPMPQTLRCALSIGDGLRPKLVAQQTRWYRQARRLQRRLPLPRLDGLPPMGPRLPWLDIVLN
jgi:hypothetical protein